MDEKPTDTTTQHLQADSRIGNTVDRAKSLADPALISLRREALNAEHMAPLMAFVEELRRSAPAGVPDFDPFDGGVHSECLFLLEAPGAKAVRSGFISRNNPDETAKNFFHLNAEASLARERTITWNAVPWYLGDGKRIRAAIKPDLKAAEVHIRKLLLLLPKLAVVVLVGKKAQRFEGVIRSVAPTLAVLHCPHPSPLALNGRPERRNEIHRCLSDVAAILAKISLAPDPSAKWSFPKQPGRDQGAKNRHLG